MKKIMTRVSTAVGSAGFALATPFVAFAQGTTDFGSTELGEIRGASGLGDKSLPLIIGGIINVLLGILGIIAIVIVIIAGFTWMTAAGNEEKVTSAKTMLRNAIIGIVLIVAAYSISAYIISSITTVAG